MKQFVFSKNLKRVLRTFLFLSVSLMLFSACSDDETYTGRLSVVFTDWDPEWTGRTVIVVTPIDNEDKILNMQKAVRDSKHIIELNPGNYTVIVEYQHGNGYNIARKYVQVQIGKTAVVEMN